MISEPKKLSKNTEEGPWEWTWEEGAGEDSGGRRRRMGSRKQEKDGEDTGGGHGRRTVTSWAVGVGRTQ